MCLLLMIMKRMLRNEKSFNVWNCQKGDGIDDLNDNVVVMEKVNI